MSKTWLAVIAMLLGACGAEPILPPLHGPIPAPPVAAAAATPAQPPRHPPAHATGPAPAPAPALTAPYLPPPVEPHSPAGCVCCGGGNTHGPLCERLRAWVTYHPLVRGGCCSKCDCCGYHCFRPIYHYFVLPCDVCLERPPATPCAPCTTCGFWRHFCASGHRMFSSPGGFGCCGGLQ
jgi:hypothetical protein